MLVCAFIHASNLKHANQNQRKTERVCLCYIFLSFAKIVQNSGISLAETRNDPANHESLQLCFYKNSKDFREYFFTYKDISSWIFSFKQ